MAYNTDEKIYLVSSISIVFKVSREDILLSNYLFMFFNRPEFDRYARFHSWGSARETFSWADMCDISIHLPPIEIQKKFSDVCVSLMNFKGLNLKLSEICPILIKGSLDEGKMC